ncbi:hypothetical protein KUG47_12565 [Falsochrobactrum sp. TDYN1]|uniref:Flagellar protein n=1 Tax=Falsochrobactrum tianjinense TaxID=2706015 RepID=A0A949UUZ6_9HYPH|nr:hypothetical protein [Falsochrobactrum sp. TDYN1]MBV2144327.1 hypothetical protein [Falsochrobactrum sp. TDYN1]
MRTASRKNHEKKLLAELAAEVEAVAGKGAKKPPSKMDRYLKAAAFTLAAGSAMLPFIAYLQRADLGPAEKSESRITDPLDRSDQKMTRRFPSFLPSDQVARVEDIDDTMTGSVMSNGAGLPGSGAGKEGDSGGGQPFPKPVFALREVVGGMAMIEDASGYWFVEKGSLLPDGSRLVSIARGAGSWQLTTSSGDVIELVK